MHTDTHTHQQTASLAGVAAATGSIALHTSLESDEARPVGARPLREYPDLEPADSAVQCRICERKAKVHCLKLTMILNEQVCESPCLFMWSVISLHSKPEKEDQTLWVCVCKTTFKTPISSEPFYLGTKSEMFPTSSIDGSSCNIKSLFIRNTNVIGNWWWCCRPPGLLHTMKPHVCRVSPASCWNLKMVNWVEATGLVLVSGPCYVLNSEVLVQVLFSHHKKNTSTTRLGQPSPCGTL